MSKLRELVSSPIGIVVAIAISSVITNGHVKAQTTENSPVNSNLEAVPSLDPNNQTDTDDSMGQVTNVSQLRDVLPGDWAFEALRNLVERYGCIAGYPDGTFRGNRALSRYEFAAGLNACLDQIQQFIAASTTNLVTKEDLGSLQKLQEEFAAELATLRGRVDALEARTSELEANQFSTTTRLNGFVWFNITGATAGDNVLAEGTQALGFSPAGPSALRDPATGFTQPSVRQVTKDPNITFSTLTWLTLNTSFSGRDALITTLASGNGNSPVNEFGSAGTFNNSSVPFTDQTPRAERGNSEIILSELYYQFPVNDSFQLVVGPAVNYNSFFDFNRFTLLFNGTGSFQSTEHPLIANVKRGAGAIAIWKINDQFKLNVAYLGQNTEFLPGFLRTASDPSKGLFGGTNSSIAELTFSPNQNTNIRFIYGYSNIMPNPIGQVQPLWSLHGVADDGPGGSPQGGLGYSQVHAFGVNFDWLLNPKFGIFGRYNYAITQLNPNSGVPDDEITAQAFQLGAAFPDLGRRGALATLSFVMPFDVTSGRQFLVSGGGNGGTQYNIEATYFYPITRNIAIVPAFYAIINPNNFDSNPAIFVGNLRTQISF